MVPEAPDLVVAVQSQQVVRAASRGRAPRSALAWHHARRDVARARFTRRSRHLVRNAPDARTRRTGRAAGSARSSRSPTTRAVVLDEEAVLGRRRRATRPAGRRASSRSSRAAPLSSAETSSTTASASLVGCGSKQERAHRAPPAARRDRSASPVGSCGARILAEPVDPTQRRPSSFARHDVVEE